MWFRSLLLALAGCLLFAVSASAQGNPTGTITGDVVDAQGLALPGVAVTVHSPALQGTRTVVTSANGDYIIPFLPAGDYTVTFELASFKPLTEKVRVALAQSVSLNAKLVVAVAETVTVVGERGEDFAQSAAVATSYKADLIEKLPTGRTLLAAVNLAPGVHATGPSNNITISGAMSYENVFMINGVVAQDNIRSTPFNLFIEDAIQETTITTAGISAEYGRFAGGVVNAITKSGGNEFSGSFRTTFDNNKWVALTPFPNDSRTNKVTPTYEATLGGPIFKDKLWFFGAARMTNPVTTVSTGSLTNIAFQQDNDEKRYEGKLTYSVNPNHTFKGSYITIRRSEKGNTFPNPQGILDLASLVDRSLPQQLGSVNYTGIITPKFFVEAQVAVRKFTFENSGSQFTDIIKGTLLVDRQNNNARYHSPTFCGVCSPEKRDNQNLLLKASYFLSTAGFGSHNLVAGFDGFNDQRFANNHQSGSDYRILGTTSLIRNGEIFPVFNSDRTTIIQWNPIFVETQGNNFRTYSGFVNDAWRFSNRVAFNLGARYDKNSGKDSIGRAVVKDSAVSPRLSATIDPRGDGRWTINAGYGKYVAAIANSVGDAASPGGQPATFQYDYLGSAINVDPTGPLVNQDEAIRRVFDWFLANGGTDRTTRGAPTIPGVTGVIADALASPNVRELSLGVSRRLGSRGLFRVDGIYRDFQDFYSNRTDLTTGRVSDRFGRSYDRAITENTNDIDRKYKAINAQISYRVGERVNLGGNYTLSHSYGNFDGETVGGGPQTTNVKAFPEYKDLTWNNPAGDLGIDQRHRARGWVTWDVPTSAKLGQLNLALLEQFATGVPYGAIGVVDTRPYVTNPGYLNPPATVNYYFTARDAFRTENVTRTDLAFNYSHRLGVGQRTALFARLTVFNVFNQAKIEDVNNIDTSVLTRNNASRFQAFNPFNSAPVQGTHWDYGTSFGKPLSRFAYQTPRTYSFSVGMRF